MDPGRGGGLLDYAFIIHEKGRNLMQAKKGRNLVQAKNKNVMG